MVLIITTLSLDYFRLKLRTRKPQAFDSKQGTCKSGGSGIQSEPCVSLQELFQGLKGDPEQPDASVAARQNEAHIPKKTGSSKVISIYRFKLHTQEYTPSISSETNTSFLYFLVFCR